MRQRIIDVLLAFTFGCALAFLVADRVQADWNQPFGGPGNYPKEAAKPDAPKIRKVKIHKAVWYMGTDELITDATGADMTTPAAKILGKSAVALLRKCRVEEVGDEVEIEIPMKKFVVPAEYLNPQGKVKEWGLLAKDCGMKVQDLKAMNKEE